MTTIPALITDTYFYPLVPYPPNVISYESPKHTEFRVKRSAATEGPSTFSFESFYRLETTDPDGEWTYRGIDTPYGSCDFTADWCYVWGTQAFHNYTVRIVPFNVGGYGFGADPYRVTTLEDSKYCFNFEVYCLFCIDLGYWELQGTQTFHNHIVRINL